MKVRLDYVTNSSSSSFIIACKSEEEMVKTINEELVLYSDEVKNTIIEDARNGQRDVSEYIEDAADEYARNRLTFIYEFGRCGRKGSWVDKWREKHPDANWFAYEDDAEYKALYKKYYDEKFNEISDKLKGNDFVSIVEYEDHTNIGSLLEHEIMPDLSITKEIISYH